MAIEKKHQKEATQDRSAQAKTAMGEMKNNNEKPRTLSIAILGGGISGLSCASRLLSQHKQSYPTSSSYELEVTVFDTGRLRPGGRCSSRLPGDDVPAAVAKNMNGNRNNPRGNPSNNEGNTNETPQVVPDNIQKALNGAVLSNENSSRDRIVNGMGPVDHAAQILSVPSSIDSSFHVQLEQWLKEGVVESFPEGSVCELLSNENNEKQPSSSSSSLQTLKGEMYYGKGGMGNIPIAMRERCLSFNGFGDNYTGQSFRILQDVWVSPSNGVKYIQNKDDIDDSQPQWELRAGNKSLGKYHRLVIAHNGKCADRIMSKTPAKAFHSLLRTKFAPYVPQWGGKEMTLNSIYSLVFAVKSEKEKGDGSGLSSPIAKAISRLSSSQKNDGVYTVMIKNEPSLRLLSCNTLKHHHDQNENSKSNYEVYTLLSSPKFGKQFKGPQENLPLELTEKVVMKMMGSLERSLALKEGSVVETVVDLKLQLWGAAVPMNTWTSTDKKSGADGFVYDATYGVGAAGDWILDPSVAGAWESGQRLANWMLRCQDGDNSREQSSVGLPDPSSKGGNSGKFLPSPIALGSGIGTIPSSPNSAGFEFPSKEQSNRPRGPPRNGSAGSTRQPNNGGTKNSNRRRSNTSSRPTQSAS